DLNGGNENGNAEYSAGDIWLLPYWMGRYLKVISAPVEKKKIAHSLITKTSQHTSATGEVYRDESFDQRFSIKYYFSDSGYRPVKILSDHNGNIKVLAGNTLFIPRAEKILEPGTLVKDVSYRPIRDKKISGICLYKNEFIFSDEHDLSSNAWAGKLFVTNNISEANRIVAGKDFSFLV
ncbi:MAG: hypothetical protein ABUT20_55940, partial [Bacteroidota bacterium]